MLFKISLAVAKRANPILAGSARKSGVTFGVICSPIAN